MATTTGFKQQCPSCEALVPIKDVGLIGKKIDCPKCKYRFTVEEPADTEAEEGQAAPKSKVGANGAAKNGLAKNGTAVKSKEKKRRGEDEEAAGDGAKKVAKKKGAEAGKNKMMVGVALAGVGVIVLGIAAYFMFVKKSDNKQQANNNGGNDKKDDKKKDDKKDDKKGAGGEGDKASSGASEQLTNLLLKKTEHVTHLNLNALRGSSLGKAIEEMFPDAYCKALLGFSIKDIEEIIRSESYGDDWSFNLVRTSQPVSMDAVAKALSLKPAKEVIKDHKYFLASADNAFLNRLGRLSLSKRSQPADVKDRSGPVAVHQYDETTLVFADEVAMKLFLNDNRQPKTKERKPTTKPNDQTGGVKRPPFGPPTGGGFNPMGPPNSGGFKPPSGPPSGGGVPSKGGPAKASADKTFQAPMGPPNGPPSGFGPPSGKGPPNGGFGPPTGGGTKIETGKEDKKSSAGISQSYTTIDARLGDMMLRMDRRSKDTKVLFKTATLRKETAGHFKHMWDITRWFDQEPAKVQTIGTALVWKDNQTYVFVNGLDCDNSESATELAKDLQTNVGPDLAKFLADIVGIKLEMLKEETKDDKGKGNPWGPPFGGGGMGGMGGGGPFGPPFGGGAGGGAGKGGGPIYGPPAGSGGPPVFGRPKEGTKADPPKGGKGGGKGAMGGGPMPGPGGGGASGGGPIYGPPGGMAGMGGRGGMGGGPFGPPTGGGSGGKGGEDEEKEEKIVTGIRVNQDGDFVSFRVQFALNRTEIRSLERAAFLVLKGLKGELDLAGGISFIHRLGKGVASMAARDKRFPSAAMNRDPDRARSLYPWEPEKRISWMAQLLPMLGHDRVYQQINKKKSWDDNENLLAARTLIPEFINPAYATSSRYVTYGKLPVDVAATHYVAIAGLGEDAADEESGDHLGVFGYNRSTSLSAMEKGASNTAVMIQVPPDFVTPWMAGGGSTVRGVPHTRSLDPFVSVKLPNGDVGTYVLMGDGSVRFVKNTIAPEVFKSMVTLKGPLVAKQKPDDWNVVPNPEKPAEMKGGKKPPVVAPKK